MARAATRKVVPPKVIVHAPDVPEVVQAAQIAQIAMRAAKVETWDQFVGKTDGELRALISLTADQQGILEDNRHILPYLQVSPLVTVAACSACGRYGLVSSAAVPAKCAFTLRCPGSVTKASVQNYQPRPKK